MNGLAAPYGCEGRAMLQWAATTPEIAMMTGGSMLRWFDGMRTSAGRWSGITRDCRGRTAR